MPVNVCRSGELWLPAFLHLIISELSDMHDDDLNLSGVRKQIHIRQVVIYLSNVSFGISMRQLAKAFELNRSTIAYACRTIEERRDNPKYDRFLGVAEKITTLALAKYNEA